jgi:hypothetical protein
MSYQWEEQTITITNAVPLYGGQPLFIGSLNLQEVIRDDECFYCGSLLGESIKKCPYCGASDWRRRKK